MRLRVPRFHHLAAFLLIVSVGTPLLWRSVSALGGGATADKANNPRSADPGMPPETCNKAGCHTTQPSGGCTGKVELLGLPSCYTPGTEYTLTVKITDPNAMRWGFEVGAQYNEGNQWDYQSAGQVSNIAGQRTKSVNSGDGMRQFITHDGPPAVPDGTYAGVGGPVQWQFKWKAPAANERQTQVCFYVAGVAGNNDETRNLDCVYNAKVCVNPCAVDARESTWGTLKTKYR